ncbi:hypothetical protein LOAG_15865, partial [Loa loa]
MRVIGYVLHAIFREITTVRISKNRNSIRNASDSSIADTGSGTSNRYELLNGYNRNSELQTVSIGRSI